MTSRLQSFQLAIVGDPGVGKSCLISRFVDNTFSRDRRVYLGACYPKVWAINLDGTTVKLTVYDMTGVKRMRPLVRANFNHIDGFIVAYDCTDLESFKNVEQWIQDIDRYGPADANKLLVGTKCDLVMDKKVDFKTAEEYADKLQIPLVETSAKKASNVEQAFVTLATQIKNRVERSLRAAHPAITAKRRVINTSNASSTPRPVKKTRSDIDEKHATDLNNKLNSNKLKENQESMIKIVGELTARLEKAASSITSVAEKFTASADRVHDIEEKFPAAIERAERREEKEETAEKEDNSLCKSCENKVKLRLERECNIL